MRIVISKDGTAIAFDRFQRARGDRSGEGVPVILGGGTAMFPTPGSRINLRVVETRTFGSGVVYLRYQRADEVG